jgi:peptidyl-prolyl cis-trans isomerase C
MRHLSTGAVLGVFAAVAVGYVHRVMADGGSRNSQVVVKVGATAITASEIEQRLLSLPTFQLASLGQSADEIRRNAVEKIVVAEAVFAVAAAAKRIDERPAIRDKIVDVLRSARLGALAADLSANPDVGPEAVSRYYEENQARFESPERINVWRILCATRDDAAQILQALKAPRALDRWGDLARERSIDKATAMRGGDLGFLSADGVSTFPTVRADPALVDAARKVKDGAIVPDPIAEGTAFAVVWRRSTAPAVRRTLEQEAPAIRQLLVRQKVEQASRDLVANLRRAKAVEVHPEVVDAIEEPLAQSLSRGRTAATPAKPEGPPAPSSTPRGLR